MSLLAPTLALCALFPQAEPKVIVTNPAAEPRTELVRVSVPWPRGAHPELPALRIGDDVAPCAILERWADGSVAVAQAHARVTLGAGETREFGVRPAEEPGGDAPQWRWPDELPLVTEVVDPFGRTFVATFETDPRRPLEEWAQTRRVRVRRFLAVHERHADEDATGLLGLRAWLVEFAGERRAELTVVVRNDPMPGEPVIGPVRFSEVALRTLAPAVRVRPRLREANLLEPPSREPGGGWRQVLLGPSDHLYLGDRTGKAFRFDLFLDGEAVPEEERSAARLSVERPLLAMPDLGWVRATGAFGAHGGPAPSPERESERGAALVHEWRLGAGLEGGPFGAFGDVREIGADGSLRSAGTALHNVLRWRSAALLLLAEAAVLQQTLRPTPATVAREPADTAWLRAGLGPRAKARPHGFGPLDYEHFSVALLHDWYWLTGDPLARAELARAGTGLLPMLGSLPFRTSRGDGQTLEAGVLIARATGDRMLLEALLARAREVILPELGPVAAVAQPPHPDALGAGEAFDAPWQMAILVRGLASLWRATGAGDVRAAVTDVARRIAIEGWEDEVGPKAFVAARDPAIHAMPVGHDPEVGTAWLLLDAFVLASEATESDADRALFARRAASIVRALEEPQRGGALAHPWFQLWFDRHPP